MRSKLSDDAFVREKIKEYQILFKFANNIEEVEGLALEVFQTIIRELTARNKKLTKDVYLSMLRTELAHTFADPLTQSFWESWGSFVWETRESFAREYAS